ncbi:MAG: hypothetical protein RIQ52_1523, partial [Pseudomonadota bacterium]
MQGEHTRWPYLLMWLHTLMTGYTARAEDVPTVELPILQEVEVHGKIHDLPDSITSASQGQVTHDDFRYRPIARPGELIEVVPGMISTQHSGTGKANQYFLRGFNLDHGTDFTTWIDGIPMNLRSNAHGQGYMDLNSLIPELVDTVEFGKGPYYADQGDFSSAGYARIQTFRHLDGFNHNSTRGYVKLEGGQFDYYRGLLTDSLLLGSGDLLYAFEYTGFMGPWVVPENSSKYNGMLKYTFDWDDWQVSLNAKSYYSHWIASNQIPMLQLGQSLTPTCCNRAGMSGVGPDGRFGSMNPSDGGVTSRYSGSLNARSSDPHSTSSLDLYALYYDLDLFSDFSYFSANPYQGDQIHQQEHRIQTGANAEHAWHHVLHGMPMEEKLGVQFRYDGIRNLGVSNTYARKPVIDPSYLPASLYNIDETSLWLYAENEIRWLDWLRSITAARSDTFWFDVSSIQPGFAYNDANSGSTAASVLSPKFNLIFGPWKQSEWFINSGYSYHSNDARGTVLHYNPDGSEAQPVSPVAWSRGAETGLRTQFLPGLNSTFAVWFLQMSDELVFVGDAGTTESTGATSRVGIELTNFYRPLPWLSLDADIALTQSRYREATDPGCGSLAINVPARGCLAGYSVPNAVGMVLTTGARIELPQGF